MTDYVQPLRHQARMTRRRLFGVGTALAAVAASHETSAAARIAKSSPTPRGTLVAPAAAFGFTASTGFDQTAALQVAIDQTSAAGVGLTLPPGRYLVGGLRLRPGTRLIGAPGTTVLSYNGTGTCLLADGADGIRLEHVSIAGGGVSLDPARASALLDFTDCKGLLLDNVHVSGSGAHGIRLRRCSGRITTCHVEGAHDAALWSEDADTATGALTVTDTTVFACADNGILVWRTTSGHDGTRISGCRIAQIGNRSGGSGQYGNGINVYRAGGVMVSGNAIADCAYSAVRGNAAGNIQMRGNHAMRSGEVALYAEFGFEGAVMSDNLVESAATGIAVTNFDVGGRLAVVHGNLVRTLRRREFEPVDTRGDGIVVEADAVVANNVVEDAAAAGLRIGWGRHMRDVVASGNLLRASRIGIAVSGDPAAGRCLINGNLISGHTDGAIRATAYGTAIGADLVGGGLFGTVMVQGNSG